MSTSDLRQKLTRSSKRNPCPICQNTHGCKISDHLIICLRAERNWSINGWEYRKDARGGMGSVWSVPKNSDQSHQQEYRRSQQKKTETRVQLTDAQLDYNARLILKQLGLLGGHREQLKQRGLTDSQIDQLGFKSVDQWQEFNLTPINSNFPGIGKRGGLLNIGAGYLIPVRNRKNLILGFQVARDDRDPKYQWLKDSRAARKQDELPLQFCRRNNSTQLNLIEGTLKPLIAAFRHNLNVLGAGGVIWHSSPKQLQESLEGFTEIILNPDGGSMLNPSVLKAYRELYQVLQSLGYELFVRDWGQGNQPKGESKDLDEIDTETFHQARLVPYSQWDFTYADEQLKQQLEEQERREKAAETEYYNKLKFTPDIVYNEQFCSSPLLPKNGEMLMIKYATSQGKSQYLIASTCSENDARTKDLIISNLVRGQWKNDRVLRLSYRNSLEVQFASNSDFYHLREDDGLSVLGDPAAKITCCIDSIHLIPDDWFTNSERPTHIILDEIESVTRHFINGNTLQEKQDSTIKKFRKFLNECDSVIGLDGGLTDRVCDYYRDISNKEIIKVGNDYPPKRPPVFHYSDINSDRRFKKVLGAILEEELPWIFTDSIAECEAFYRDLLENGRNPLLITRDTKGKKLGKEIADYIDQFLRDPDGCINSDNFAYDCIISSPIIESGVDIKTDKVTAGFYLFKHLEINSILQIIMRLRSPEIPRYLATVRYVDTQKDSEIKSPFERTLQKINQARRQDSLYLENLGEWQKRTEEEITRIIADSLNSPENRMFDYFDSLKFYEKANYKATLLKRLNRDGFTVENIPIETVVEDNHQENKQAYKEEFCQDVPVAPDIDEKTAHKWSKSSEINYQQKCSLLKFRLAQMLPEMAITPELVMLTQFKDKTLIKEAENRHLLNNPEEIQRRQHKRLAGIIKNKPLMISHRSQMAMLREFHRLGVLELIDGLRGDSLICNDSPAVKSLWQSWGKKQTHATGISRGKHPTTLLKRILSRLGYELFETNRDRKSRYYCLVDKFETGLNQAIFGAVGMRLNRVEESVNWGEVFLISETPEPLQGVNYSDDKMIENSIYFIDPFVIKDETAEEQAIAFQLTEGWRNDDLAVPFDVLDLYPVEKVKRAMAHLCSECWSWVCNLIRPPEEWQIRKGET